MIRYVLGFMNYKDNVLAIKKERPFYLRGQWNGLGGKIHDNEPKIQAMVRGFHEECGVITTEDDWTHCFTIKGEDYIVYVYFAESEIPLELTQTTDEVLKWFKWWALPLDDVEPMEEMIRMHKTYKCNPPILLERRELRRCRDCEEIIYDNCFVYTCETCQHTYCNKCMNLDEMKCYSCGGKR